MYGKMDCPYCNYSMNEPDEPLDEGQANDWECSACSKKFIARLHLDTWHETEKVPCMNDEAPHDWKRNKYTNFQGKERWECRNCEKREWRDEEVKNA
jgi:hypothetical protein